MQFACCEEDGCRGAQLEGGHCLEHLTAEEFDIAVACFRGGARLDARATSISAERLDALLAALKRDDGRAVFPAVDFGGATFSGEAAFAGAAFSGDAGFDGVTFRDRARFDGAAFSADVAFDRAIFSHDAAFAQAIFSGDAAFNRAIFRGDAGFVGASFSGYASFVGASFSGYAGFGGASFSGYAGFVGSTFSDTVGFYGTTFSRDADFVGTSFERAREIGPFLVGERLVLNRCVFGERVSIEVAATIVSARWTTFAAGVNVRVRWAEVALDNADFARPSTLSGAITWRMDSDLQNPSSADDRRIELQPRPRLITLRGAHVADLSLSQVDLRACRFFGAHGLGSLSIEASCTWGHTPPRRRYSHRETIAEEHLSRGSSWEQPSTQPPQWLGGRDGTEQLRPPQIAALYRALRKAREDSKDQAGAGDLYYGEMEMRRKTSLPARGQRGRARARSDRFILATYWLLSGYGLKASRAFIILLIAIVLGSLGLDAWGFTPDPSYTRALLYSIESTSSLFRVPNAPGLDITYAGESMQIALRILGPLFIGLALLALRARVKR